jgi:hypothetical protein
MAHALAFRLGLTARVLGSRKHVRNPGDYLGRSDGDPVVQIRAFSVGFKIYSKAITHRQPVAVTSQVESLRPVADAQLGTRSGIIEVNLDL